MKKKIRFGFREKMMVIIMMVSMMITVIMGLIFYQRSEETIKTNYRNVIQESLKGRAGSFDSIMKEVYLVCVNTISDQSLKDEMQGNRNYEGLASLLSKKTETLDTIQSIYCYVNASDTFVRVSAGSNHISKASKETKKWMEEILDKSKRNCFSPIYNIEKEAAFPRNLFTFGKKIYDKKGAELGALFINVDERQVYYECLQSKNESIDEIMILQDNRVVSSRMLKKLGQDFSELGYTDAMVIITPMEDTEYTMCSVSDLNSITGELKKVKNWIILIAVLLNLLFSIPIFLVMHQIMYPMRELEDTMGKVMEGDLTVRARVWSEDEIGSLADSFNNMLDQIEILIDEIAEQKLLKKEAELEALSYQITPHFMYNTLSSIRFAAQLGQYEKLPDLLQAFIELLRLSASDRGAFITVQQEMRMVNNYIKLQQFRYEDSFSAEVRVEKGVEFLYVPRLLVQPLVENSILHGLNHNNDHNRILVEVTKSKGDLVITISDNGAGMTETEIRDMLAGKYRNKFSGIGVNNIIERLQLYYGSRGKLEYHSTKENGTRAVLTMPASDDPDAYSI